ncbi:hypothetical protein ACRAWF_18870 [Streptomyces sp. L7]
MARTPEDSGPSAEAREIDSAQVETAFARSLPSGVAAAMTARELGEQRGGADTGQGLPGPHHGDVLRGGVEEFTERQDEPAEHQQPLAAEEIAHHTEIQFQNRGGENELRR